jgi:8-oxo-dGTP diphosphatase
MEKKESKEYVLGFAFSKDKNHIVLIEKQKPNWQKDMFNGVGGKVETFDKKPIYAMIREFKEETGVDTNITHWGQMFAKMVFNDDVMGGKAVVYCYRMSNDIIFDCKTMETEKIHILSTEQTSFLGYDSIIGKPCLKNLQVLIPMAADEDFIGCTLNIL